MKHIFHNSPRSPYRRGFYVAIFMQAWAFAYCLRLSPLSTSPSIIIHYRRLRGRRCLLPTSHVFINSAARFYYDFSFRFAPESPYDFAVKASIIANTSRSSGTSSEEEGNETFSHHSISSSFVDKESPYNNNNNNINVQNKRKPFAFGTLAKRTQRLLTLTDPNYVPGSNLDAERSRVKITRRTFNNLIDNWAFSGHADLVQQIEALVQRMEDMFERNVQVDDDDEEDEEEDIHKNDASKSSNAASVALAPSGNIQPDSRTYTKVIYALAKSGERDAGVRAQKVLMRMNELYESGVNVLAKPNAYAFAGVLQAMSDDPYQAQQLLFQLLKKYEETHDKDFQPTDRCFQEVIHAFAKVGKAHEAEQTLSTMEALYQSRNSMYAELRPNRVNFNAVIHGWANSGEEGAARRSEELLARMEQLYKDGVSEEVKPNVKDYNAVIDAWSKSGAEEAGQKAEQILDRMQMLYDQTGDVMLKPNVRSYNSAINAWAKSRARDSAEKAERLLFQLEKRFKEEKQFDLQPDIHSYSTVVNAWARSVAYGKAERAQEIYKHMMDVFRVGNMQVRPNIVIYNALLNACAYTVGSDVQEQTRAIEIASETFREIEQSPFCNPDQVTYGTFLKVCATQMPEGEAKERAVEAVFKKCCKEGQVSELVLRQFQSTATTQQCQKLLGKTGLDIISVDILPKEWRRNVKERKTHGYNSSQRKRSGNC